MELGTQLFWLFILAIPIACISWTVTHEEIFREPRTYFIKRSVQGRYLVERKFFFMLTCEFCFSHYITILMLIITNYTLLFDDWRGYLISGFSLVWIANVYMSLYTFLKVDIKKEKIITKQEEKKVQAGDTRQFQPRGPSAKPENKLKAGS